MNKRSLTKLHWRLAILLLGVLAVGCDSPQSVGVPSILDLDKFVAHQNQRAALLQLLESGGTIELRQDTEDGRSFDDCALDLWRDHERFALRLRKLGERFLWVGSDGEQWWVFELAAEPVRLVVLPSDAEGGNQLGADILLLGPRQLLHMAGLEPLGAPLAGPRNDPDSKLVQIEFAAPASDTWARLAWYVDPSTLLPERIEALDAEGKVLVQALLSGYEPIRARDQPLGNWPQFARKIRISEPEGSTDVRIFFNRPSASGSRLRDALFQLDGLMEMFKPGVIEYIQR